MDNRAARNFFVWGTAACTAVFLWLTFNTHTTIPKRTNTDQLTDEVVSGKRVWHRYNCNDCHTILGIGGYYSPDVTKVYSSRGDVWLKTFLRNPESTDPKRRKMLQFNLTEEEVHELIAFFQWVDAIDTNQWPPKPITEVKLTEVGPKVTPQTLLGKNIFEQYRCDLCHKIGNTGGMIGPELTHVGGRRDPLWLAQQVKDPRSHKPDGQMPPFPQISEGDTQSLADYLASLK